MKKLLLLLCCGVFGFMPALKSQVTTSAITGYISGDDGQPLPGANIVATHIPSGTIYGIISREGGGFTLPDMRIGGPYSLEVTFIGYDKEKFDGIYLKL